MSNIKKVSSFLIYTFNIILILMFLWVITLWVLVDWPPFKALMNQHIFSYLISSPKGLINIADFKFNSLSKIIGFIGSVVDTTPMFLGVVILRHIFKNYKNGDIFSIENARGYKKIGWLFLVNALIVAPITEMLMSLAISLNEPIGSRIISISFGTTNLADIFIGIVIIVISWVMAEGHKLQQENKFTI